MQKTKKGLNMKMTAPLPLPTYEEKRALQADVNQQLYALVEPEIKKRRVKMTQIMEWALKCYLVQVNPKKAQEYGIMGDFE